MKKGFTLIELLVVISIIGLLSSIVFASLVTARTKANDSKIISLLSSMRAQSELYTGVGGVVVTGACTVIAGTLFETINNGLGNLILALLPITPNTRCINPGEGLPTNGARWAAAAKTSTGAWCVDSTGVSRDRKADGVTLYTTVVTALSVQPNCL